MKRDNNIEMIDPPTLNQHPFYSQVSTVLGSGKLIFVAGQVDRPVDYEPRSNVVRHPGDYHGQWVGTMENVRLALDAAGASFQDVVFLRTFVIGMDNFINMLHEMYAEIPDFFGGHRPPPQTLVEVARLSEPSQLMEVEVIACVPETTK